MKYKLLKDISIDDGYPKGTELIELNGNYYFPNGLFAFTREFIESKTSLFEPIQEKKTYDTITEHDMVFWIGGGNGNIIESPFIEKIPRSETFFTREEAEDEHKRREYLTRECSITHGDIVYFWNKQENCVSSFKYSEDNSIHIILRNSRMLFNSSQECIDTMKNFDLVRLFLTER